MTATETQTNLTRTAVELMFAYINATNSCHSNSADEPFTTPSEENVRLAAQAQAILLEDLRHPENGQPVLLLREEEAEVLRARLARSRARRAG